MYCTTFKQIKTFIEISVSRCKASLGYELIKGDPKCEQGLINTRLTSIYYDLTKSVSRYLQKKTLEYLKKTYPGFEDHYRSYNPLLSERPPDLPHCANVVGVKAKKTWGLPTKCQ